MILLELLNHGVYPNIEHYFERCTYCVSDEQHLIFKFDMAERSIENQSDAVPKNIADKARLALSRMLELS